MEGGDHSQAHVWDGRAGPPRAHRLPPPERADELAAAEMIRPPSRRKRPDGPEPYSLAWFETVERNRYARYGAWIPRLFEFAKHAGETVLGLGDTLGTDWAQFARHGCRTIIGGSSGDHLALCRRNFELRGLTAQFLHAAPTRLPLAPCSIDVVCLTGLLAATPDTGPLVEEVYRVLRPGGKVVATAPARYAVEYWRDAFLPWQRWFRGRSGGEGGRSYSGRELREMLPRFSEHRVFKRQVRRSDLPHIWRWMPLPLMERLIGRTMVVKAFKPLSAALPVLAAA